MRGRARTRGLARIDYEFYETPHAFTRYLFDEVPLIRGRLFEPTVGSGAIVQASQLALGEQMRRGSTWVTNDLDERWPADYHLRADEYELWRRVGMVDWTIGNPPFTPALDIIAWALRFSRVGIAMHLRASIHEVLKTGIRRTWMRDHTPTGTVWLPRFGYQRSPTTGKWTTDSVCACWVIWLRSPKAQQFIRYAPPSVLDELEAETPGYRRRMDEIMRARACA